MTSEVFCWADFGGNQDVLDFDVPLILTTEIDFKHITNPDDPRYKDIEKIHCFSYPITTATLTTSAAKDMYKEYLTLAEEMMEYQSNKPTGVKLVLPCIEKIEWPLLIIACFVQFISGKRFIISGLTMITKFKNIYFKNCTSSN